MRAFLLVLVSACVTPGAHLCDVWNAARRSLVLTGGSEQLMDAWEWIGHPTSPPSGEWRVIPAGLGPAARASFMTGALLDGTGVFLALGTESSVAVDDPWLLQWTGDAPTEGCRLPDDRDGDLRVGCDDEDCWSVCTPACPPGAPCSTARTCGNGTCEPTDVCGLCGSDCQCAPVCGDFVCATGETCPGDCPL